MPTTTTSTTTVIGTQVSMPLTLLDCATEHEDNSASHPPTVGPDDEAPPR